MRILQDRKPPITETVDLNCFCAASATSGKSDRHPGRVEDCNVLLARCGELAGTGSLNWDTGLAIHRLARHLRLGVGLARILPQPPLSLGVPGLPVAQLQGEHSRDIGLHSRKPLIISQD